MAQSGADTAAETSPDPARDAELAGEQRYVRRLYQRLDALRADTTEQLERVRRGGATGTHQARTERDAMARLFEDRLRQLRDVDERLAFGRLQTEEDDLRYIGRIGLRDDTQHPLLLDWRAPQSSAFYQATAVTPLGVKIRRHLTTKGRSVTGIDDEVFDPEHVPDGVALTGESALLAALSAQRTGRMHDIVTTIQAEQDRIIRSDAHGVLVVQGGPGTGKTAVALHRAAYLLYAQKERLAKSGVLIVGPSSNFLHYIEQVLPSLGETGVVLSTVGQLFPGVDATALDDPHVAEVKGRIGFAEVLRRAVQARQVAPEGTTTVEIGNDRIDVPAALIARAVRRAQQTRKPHNVARVTFVREALGDLTELVVQEVVARGSTLDEEDRRWLREDIRTAHDVKVLLNSAWLPLTPEKLLGDLYTRPQYLAAVTPGWRQADRDALARPRAAAMTVSDVPLLDEAAELLGESDPGADARSHARASQRTRDIENAERAIENMGVEGMVTAEALADAFEEAGDHASTAERAALDRTWTYGHIVVDEAQELTPMQWRLLRRRGPLRSFTIVGDLAQSAAAHPVRDWADAVGALTDDFRLEELTVNYRTPRPITELAEASAAALGLPVTPSRSVRDGIWPIVETTAPAARLAERVVEAVLADRDADPVGTVAVIVPDARIGAVTAALAAGVGEQVGGPARSARITVLGPRAAKGLEFDSAIVVDRAGLIETGGAGGLYVALTRPTQRLVLIDLAD